MKYPIVIKKEPLALIRNIVLAEILIGIFIIALVIFTNLEGVFHRAFGQTARFDYFLVISSSFLQVLATLIVFLRWHNQYYGRRLSILDLILNGESQSLELKQTFRWDARQNALNKDLEKTTMKTIAGFLNSDGGKIIIGVSDNKSILGLEQDYKTLMKQDKDGFENHFNHIFDSLLGLKFRQFVKISFENVDNKEICLIDIRPSNTPSYLKLNNAEEFYIRTGNTTTPLLMSEATNYIKSHWE